MFKMECIICKKRIWFWNKFYKDSGKALIVDKETGIPIQNIGFCSERCYGIVRTPEVPSPIFFEEKNGRWIKINSHKQDCKE
jgi:hypothetical protein